MRKFISIVLAMALMLSMAACGGQEQDQSQDQTPEEVGYYTLYEMTENGETFDNAFLSSLGWETMYTLELKPDGTGVLTLEDDANPLTWKDGKITINKSGAVYTYQYQDGKITLEETTGGNMVFQKASESK